jgi:3-hydroxyacyl-CoA dehydrogenase/3-hydroxy-2-methylbutyryl-CoA dehydrogenase
VAILDLGRSKGAEVAKSTGDAALFCEADVASEEQVGAALDRAIDAFGAVHAAVNCAGIGTAGRTVDKEGRPFRLDLFELTLRVNLLGTFNVIRLAAARMMHNAPNAEGERGAIVNTASVAAFARDLATSGIRVNTIAPGLFATPMLMMLPREARDHLASQIPFPRRLGNPPEFAALACHIVENPMLNGETIRLDGAIRMQPK